MSRKVFPLKNIIEQFRRLNIWLSKQEQKRKSKPDENGSSLMGSRVQIYKPWNQ